MSVLTAASPVNINKPDGRLLFLLGQSVSLGLTLALLVVAAFSLLLAHLGSDVVPWVYISVAILGSASFYGIAELQRRWTLIQVAVVVEIGILIFLISAWAAIALLKWHWFAFAAMIAFSLIIQAGFVLIGAQAGRLFDIREIKRSFPRIVAGFVAGFMVGGMAAPLLQRWLGATEYLLLAAVAPAGGMLLFLLLTGARYRDELTTFEKSVQDAPAPPLRRLLAKRFVLMIFVYQMLSAMGSQLLDYLFLVLTDLRFSDEAALTQFFGNYTVVINLSDLLFLTLGAGLLLSRYGLRFGLMANPAVIVLMLAAGAISGGQGAGAADLFFLLIVSSRIVDVTLTDGTTRTSINAAYQALPENERTAVQTGVEGIGVPLAMGLTGVLLLLFRAIGDVTPFHVTVFALIVSLFWTLAGYLVFRDYAAQLLQTMRRRALNPVEMDWLGSSGKVVVERLLASPLAEDVRFALEILAETEPVLFENDVMDLLGQDRSEVQVVALRQLESAPLAAAMPTVRRLAYSALRPEVQGAAIRALCAGAETEDVDEFLPFLTHAEPQVVQGAMVGLLRHGGIAGVLATGAQLRQMTDADDVRQRRLGAQVIGEVGNRSYYQPLLPLLHDVDIGVRQAALVAAARVANPRLIEAIIPNLDESTTRSAASEALIALGDDFILWVESQLQADSGKEENLLHYLRLCAEIRSPVAVALMKERILHPDPEIRLALLTLLRRSLYRADEADMPILEQAWQQEVECIVQRLVAQRDLAEQAPLRPLLDALGDELDLCRQRIFSLLSYRYDAHALARAERLLLSRSGPERALALEMLEISLASVHRNVLVTLIDPRLSALERVDRLVSGAIPERAPESHLLELVENQATISLLPWTRACALYGIGAGRFYALAPTVDPLLNELDPLLRETAEWAHGKLAQ